MKRFLLASIVLFISSHAIAETKKANLIKGKEIAETVCVACHAADGNSFVSMYPRIAAQHPAYIEAQTKDIRDGSRGWGLSVAMQPMVETLSDEDIKNVSAYYAKQVALSGEADPNIDIEKGKSIYRGGIASKKVPACMACHGPRGAGIPGGSVAKDGISAFPRITGQYKDYNVGQMEAFREGSRSHAMMDAIATRLSDEEIEAVTNYIQGLR